MRKNFIFALLFTFTPLYFTFIFTKTKQACRIDMEIYFDSFRDKLFKVFLILISFAEKEKREKEEK